MTDDRFEYGKECGRERAAVIAESMGYFATARAILANGDPEKLEALIEERRRTLRVTTAGMAIALSSVVRERERQMVKWPDSELRDGTGGGLARALSNGIRNVVDELNGTPGNSFAHVLAEEVLEAFAESDPVKLRAELVQVAAVAVKWVEALDRRGAR